MLKINTRYLSWTAAVIGMATAAWFSGRLVTDTVALNTVSYWGTVATLIALLLAIAEIVHSIQTTKSIQEQTLLVLRDVKRVEDASTISDCVAAIDIITREVLSERYDAALGAFQHFRKLCIRTVPDFKAPAGTSPNLNEMSQLELKLLSATRVNASAALSKPQKHELLTRLLAVKQAVENSNPANRT
jgi:hypothetical protein